MGDSMKASGPREERETIINLNEADDMASIWTASDVIYRRLLKRLGRAYLTEDGERHAIFEFPSSFITLPRAKEKRVIPQAQLEAQRVRMQKIRRTK